MPRSDLPEVPHPSAGPREVQEFLVQSILALAADPDPDVALAKAENIVGDGIALYEYSPAFWNRKLGFQGLRIYHAIQTSRYGFVSLLPSSHQILE